MSARLEMDGLSLFRTGRHEPDHMPVLSLSGVIEWGLAKGVIEAGAFAFTQKAVERGRMTQSVLVSPPVQPNARTVSRGNDAWLSCRNCSNERVPFLIYYPQT